jgi:hypothetical protein
MPGTLKLATPEMIRQAQQALDALLLSLAIEKKAVASPDQAVARDLLPKNDLRASGNLYYFSQQGSAATWTSPAYSGTLDDDQVMGIYGVRLPTQSGGPKTSAIRFWDETGRTAIKDIWLVQVPHTDATSAPVADIFLAETPVVWQPSRGFNIDQYFIAAGEDRVVYLGRVVEPKGKTISGAKS